MQSKLLIFLVLNSLTLLTACQNQAKEAATVIVKKQPKKVETLELSNTITQKEIAEGWQLLFDGRSVDLWKGYNLDGLPKTGWEVKNGELVGHGGGDLITKEKFKDFELQLEFNLSEATNSGIFYFAQEIEGKKIYHSAPEYQLVDNSTYLETQGADIMHKHLTGDAYDLYDGVINPGIGKGKWHQAKIIIKDRHVEHWLNGKLCIEYDWNSPEWKELVANSKFDKTHFAKTNVGHIGLQDHGNEIKFRNIKIRKI